MGVNQELSLKVNSSESSCRLNNQQSLTVGTVNAGLTLHPGWESYLQGAHTHTVTEGGGHSKQVETGLCAPVNKQEPQSVPRSENTEVCSMQRKSVTSC